MKRRIISRWICLLGVPLIIMIITVTASYLTASDASGPDQIDAVSVEALPIRSMVFENSIKVSGMVAAEITAGVTARVPGVLDEIFVQEGDRVEAGKTTLFRTNALKVGKALEIAEKEFSVAECAVREKLAYRDQIEADFHKAELDFERYRRLYENDQAVSANTFEMQESRFKQAKAALNHADVLIELSREQMEQARSNVSIARKDFSDSEVKAPISGLVFKRHKEPGEMAEMGKAVIEIYDDSSVEVSSFLPQELYTLIVPGKTRVSVRIADIDPGEQLVSYKSPSIDPRLRTFEIKIRFADPPEGCVPGALAGMKVILESRTGPGVLRQSIQNRSAGKVIFAVENGIARMTPVVTGLEQVGYVEITDGSVRDGLLVVTLGQNLLNDQVPVTVIQREIP